MSAQAVLVVAKSPVAGRVKTRLGAEVGMAYAAELAAAALLDTLSTSARVFGRGRRYLALHGSLEDLHPSSHRRSLALEARGWSLIPQRGMGLGARLRHAHEDAARLSGGPVVQVGMDTPHLDAAVLGHAGEFLGTERTAVLGPAYDGGWWLLGVSDPGLLGALPSVPMSTKRTGVATRRMLARAGATTHLVETLRDVDTAADADQVAALAPHSHFARAWSGVGERWLAG
ncbi:MAG: DUF2064 domain-containing protein [Actinomycetota bacterium]|nr:DUF2064 domain-containing protein [Actinomycetota bacterium]